MPPCLEASPPPAPAARPWPHKAASTARDSSSDSEQDGDDEQEDEDTAPSDSEDEEGPSRSRRRPRIHFDVPQLQTVYHLPLKTAAERLGVCEAALKRICRRNRIHKWPYRQLSSVQRRIADLKERRTAQERGLESPAVNDPLSSLTAETFDASLRQLEEEQARIIFSAHQPRRPRKTSRSRVSYQQQPNQQHQRQRLLPGETLAGHVNGVRSKIADLPPLDLSRVDRDFPLLFLANVCESVRAYH